MLATVSSSVVHRVLILLVLSSFHASKVLIWECQAMLVSVLCSSRISGQPVYLDMDS